MVVFPCCMSRTRPCPVLRSRRAPAAVGASTVNAPVAGLVPGRETLSAHRIVPWPIGRCQKGDGGAKSMLPSGRGGPVAYGGHLGRSGSGGAGGRRAAAAGAGSAVL